MSARKLPISLTRAARDDLRDIQAYTLAEWGAGQWEVYEEALHRALELLADNPQLGRARADLPPGYRAYPVQRHLILYRVTTRSVSVSRIVHGRMDVGRALGRR